MGFDVYQTFQMTNCLGWNKSSPLKAVNQLVLQINGDCILAVFLTPIARIHLYCRGIQTDILPKVLQPRCATSPLGVVFYSASRPLVRQPSFRAFEYSLPSRVFGILAVDIDRSPMLFGIGNQGCVCTSECLRSSFGMVFSSQVSSMSVAFRSVS